MQAEQVSDPTGVPVGRGRLWFGLLGGAVAWLVHLMVSYAVAEFGCVSSLGQDIVLGISLVSWIVLALSAVTLAVAVAATAAAYGSQRRLAVQQRSGDEPVSEGAIYAAKAGWITSGLFALTIAVESLPILYYLRDC